MFFEHRFLILEEMLYPAYCVIATILIAALLGILKVVANTLAGFVDELRILFSDEVAKANSIISGFSKVYVVKEVSADATISRLIKKFLNFFFESILPAFLAMHATKFTSILACGKRALLSEYKKCLQALKITYELNSLEEFFYGFVTCILVLFFFFYMSIYSITREPNTVSSLWVIFCFYVSSTLLLYRTGRDQYINLLIRVKGEELRGDYQYYKYAFLPIVLSLYLLVLYSVYIDFFFIDVLQYRSAAFRHPKDLSSGIVVELATGSGRGSYGTFLNYAWELYPKYQTTYFDGTTLKK